MNMYGESRTFGAGRRGCGGLTRSRRSFAGLPAIGPLHHPLPFSRRHMGILRSVVQPLVRPVLDVRHHLSLCRSIRAQLVGDHALRREPLLLQRPRQQALGGGFARFRPAHIHPGRRRATTKAFCRAMVTTTSFRYQTSFRHGGLRRKQRAQSSPNLDAPPATCLIRNHDAAFQQHFLNQAQAQRKPEIKPERVGDNRRRKSGGV